jgi:3-hydroxyisobutyrate dehydrogenase-like beta-hydroxyacid dehydrogenase
VAAPLMHTVESEGRMPKRIGFIGAGIMGRPMALNLMRAGHGVTVYNRTPERLAPLAEAGVRIAPSPRAAAVGQDAVILMLTGPEAIEAVLYGPGGVFAPGPGSAPGATDALPVGLALINMSTVSPAYTDQLAARLRESAIPFIDAPVSGSKKPAEDGSLVILAGGDGEQIDAWEPVLLAMGKRVVRCGAAGQGTRMKMAVNVLLGVMMEGFCEALHFGERSGLDLEAMLTAMLSGPLACGLFEMKTGMIRSGEYPAQFPLKHMAKDLGFAIATAAATGAPVPLAEALFRQYEQGMEQGLGDRDFAAIKQVLESRGGH